MTHYLIMASDLPALEGRPMNVRDVFNLMHQHSCVFHAKPIIVSTDADQGFHGKPITDSTRSRSRFPREVDQSFHGKPIKVS